MTGIRGVAVGLSTVLLTLGTPSAGAMAATGVDGRPGPVPQAPAAPGAEGPAQYPSDRLHSPITPFVAARLRAIAATGGGRPDVFAKMGDSITVNPAFLACFEKPGWDLGPHEDLRATVRHFSRRIPGQSTSSFGRVSGAARVGAHLGWALGGRGGQSPVEQEIEALQPQFAVVMYGTNDLSFGGAASALGAQFVRQYAQQLQELIDLLISRGVVPIMSTIPERHDRPGGASLVNSVVRAVAQSRQVPLLDLNLALFPLENHGISGDGVHPTQAGNGCRFDAGSLRAGYNQRSLLALQALRRVYEVVVKGAPAPDVAQPRVQGQGTLGDPWVVPALPFVFAGDSTTATSEALRQYACGDPQAAAEQVFRFTSARTTHVRITLLGQRAYDACARSGPECTDVRDAWVNLLRAPEASACVGSGHTILLADVESGPYWLTVDRPRFRPSYWPGPYLLVVEECGPMDARCSYE